MREASRGDRAAFERLYAATSAKLYGIVLRIVRRRDVADELLQDVYLRIWQHAAQFDALRSSPISWMATIARNRALDEVKRAALPSIRIDAEFFYRASEDGLITRNASASLAVYQQLTAIEWTKTCRQRIPEPDHAEQLVIDRIGDRDCVS